MQNAVLETDNNEWAERGHYWLQKASNKLSKRGRVRKEVHFPLILTGYGIRIRVDKNTLLINNGFTHHPQKKEEHRFFPGDYNMPSRIVLLDSKGSITFDALKWLAEQNIPLMQINWKGETQNIVGSVGYAADPNIVRVQRELLNNEQGFEFSKWILEHKVNNCISTLKQIFEPAPFIAIEMLEKRVQAIKQAPLAPIRTLLGLEGISANLYFRSWYSLPLKWKGVKNKPIPEDWYRIGSRFGHYTNNRLAHHPMNAMLNYAYGILENQVRINILIHGFDPTIGYIHANSTDRTALVYDLMEPLRPLIDAKILGFIRRNIFSPGDFLLDNHGVCRLHPQFARNIVKIIEEIKEIPEITATALKKLISFSSNQENILPLH